MGKYSNSEIHNRYSDWHYKLIEIDDKYKTLYACDIDRLWIEYDFKRKAVLCVIDIKWEGGLDSISPTEKGVYDWFRERGIDCYIVYINADFSCFTVHDMYGAKYKMSDMQYANWLLSKRKF